MLGRGRTLPVPSILVIIGLGALITALDLTVVVTVLPSMMLDLKVPISELDRASWVITAYLLGYTVAMPLIGRLGDVYGYPRVYQASLVVFCVGTALVAISPSLGWMVGARVIQAVGGGATIPAMTQRMMRRIARHPIAYFTALASTFEHRTSSSESRQNIR